MKKCNEVKIKEELWEVYIFNSFILQKMGLTESEKQVSYCIDENVWKIGLKVEGLGTSDNFKYIYFNLTKCIN